MEERLQQNVALQYLSEVQKNSVDEHSNSRPYISFQLFSPKEAL